MQIEELIYYARDRIIVRHDRELEAVECRYLRAHDEFGVFIPGAVRAGLGHATSLGLSNWIVDVADQTDEMSEVDEQWEESEAFRQLFRDSTIRNIVLVVAHDSPDLDISGAQRWADDFAAALGPDFRAAATSTHDATAEIVAS